MKQMKIELSENTVNTIIRLLEGYVYRRLDLDVEDIELIIEVSKSLGELQGAVRAVKDLEELNRKIKEDYPALDTSIADFINDRINEVALKGLKNENISD